MKIKGIVFDLFDTLVWINRQQFDVCRREVARYMGVDRERLLEAMERTRTGRLRGESPTVEDNLIRCANYMGVTVSPADVERATRAEVEALSSSVQIYPGVEAMLEKLKVLGVRLALLSNASQKVEKVFGEMPIVKFFNPLIYSYRTGYSKPDPEIFQLVCRRMGIPPGEILYVGDGDFRELDGAGAAGMITARVVQPHQAPKRNDSSCWDFMIDSVLQVPRVMEELESPPGDILDTDELKVLWQRLCDADPFTARHCRRVSSLMSRFAKRDAMAW